MAQDDPFLKRLNTHLDNIDGNTTAYTVTNWTASRTLDCDGSPTNAELADLIGDLVSDLIQAGIIPGTVST